eukprot:TRINITY_DN60172_c0_g1_i1.p3 TRINITY_DN60172_c0_g1~~TRINITY_DN60172_c0_g1_i1.p3  ORF type:complete len:340 (+),score=174.36 TRINITY_DN60172_c0_g1_i1:26-1021(+)
MSESKNNNEGVIAAVTGASGYVAGELIQQLLDAGYTVRGTVRSLANKERVDQLREAFPDLELFEADLLKPGSFRKCFEGATYVFHTASPFQLVVDDAHRDLIEPAVRGTEEVVSTAFAKDSSVKRVVVTSSIAAIKRPDKPADHVFTEEDWNDVATIDKAPYFVSKVQAERKAWAVAKELGRSADLAVINPSFVLGPMHSTRTDSTSVRVMRDLLTKGAVKPYWYASCDVRDVALAHIRAAERNVTGRFIVSRPTTSTSADWTAIVRKATKDAKLLAVIVDPVRQEKYTNPRIQVSHARVTELLGVKIRTLEESVTDMAAALFDLGIISVE